MTEFPDVRENFKNISERISIAHIKSGRKDSVRLMAVVKTVPPEKIKFALTLGIDLLGENRVQELISHSEQIEDYLSCRELHFIGNLQSNKVKYIADKVELIESADSFKLIDEINRQAEKVARVMNILLEVNIGNEATKGGISPLELGRYAEYAGGLKNIKVKGLMAIPPKADSDLYFGRMQELYEKNKKIHGFSILSMGMSGDFENAVKFGSNIVRIGSALFGNR